MRFDFTMENKIRGVRAWLIESWLGGEDEPYDSLEVKRELLLNKRIAYSVYDRLVTSGEVRKAILSEVDVIPGSVLIKANRL